MDKLDRAVADHNAFARKAEPLRERIANLEAALREMVYETTHLSVCEDDGSHKCKISGAALAKARAALTE